MSQCPNVSGSQAVPPIFDPCSSNGGGRGCLASKTFCERHVEQLMSPVFPVRPVYKEGSLGPKMIPYGGDATVHSYQWQDP